MFSKEEVTALLSNYITFGSHEAPGNNLAAYCPFHKGGKESRPSLYVYVGEPTQSKHVGMAFCHTCNEGWTLTGLLKDLKVGSKIVDTFKQVLQEQPKRRKTNPLYQLDFSLPVLPEAILGVFEYIPKALVSDGFTEKTLRQYDVGFDRHRKRITFALRDHHGNLVGVSGRTVRGETPRYKIYRSELEEVVRNYEFKKGRILYGLDKFYPKRMYTSIDKPVVLCEGFKACLWCVQAGHSDSVALLGSFLSREQKTLLQRVTNEVVIFLDNDQAGLRATEQVIEQLSGIEVRVANYGTSEPISPDDLSKKEVREAINTALRPYDWRRQNVRQ